MNLIKPARRARRLRTAAVLSGLVAAGVATTATPAQASTYTCHIGVCATVYYTVASSSQVTTLLTTNVPTSVYYFVFDKDGKVAFTKHDTALTTTHTLVGTGLHPGNDYTWAADLIDAKNVAVLPQGAVTTQSGRVQVRFDSVTVTDDSDLVTAGDFTIDGRVADSVVHFPGERTISSGSTSSLGGTTLTIDDNGISVNAKLKLRDDDCPWYKLCLSGLDDSWSHGSSSEADWATASTTLSTHNQDGQWHSASAAVSSDVGFTANLAYRVID